jgi:hypothetical protein
MPLHLQNSHLWLLLYLLPQNNKMFLRACSFIWSIYHFPLLFSLGVHEGTVVQTFRQDWLTSLWILAIWHGSTSLEKCFFVSIKYKGPRLLDRHVRNTLL